MFHVVKRDENEFLHVIDCLDNHYWSNLVSNIFFLIFFFFLQNDWSQQGFVIEYMLPYLRIRKKIAMSNQSCIGRGARTRPCGSWTKWDVTIPQCRNIFLSLRFYVKSIPTYESGVPTSATFRISEIWFSEFLHFVRVEIDQK